MLGVGSIAVGFAFKDIFQNLVAGVILLSGSHTRKAMNLRRGYRRRRRRGGDAGEHIRTIDRRLVIIPNVKIFTEAITVNTDCDFLMTNYTLSIAYGGDPRRAMEIVRAAIKTAEGVHPEPPPEVAIEALNDYAIDLFIAYAAGPTIIEQITTKGAVLLAIHDACRANDIALSFPTQVNLLRPYDTDENRPDKLDGVPKSRKR